MLQPHKGSSETIGGVVVIVNRLKLQPHKGSSETGTWVGQGWDVLLQPHKGSSETLMTCNRVKE